MKKRSVSTARGSRPTRSRCSASSRCSAAISAPARTPRRARRSRSCRTACGTTGTRPTRTSSADVIRVNGVPTTVVGVMPEHFEFPQNDRIWIPLQTDPNATNRQNSPQYQVIGKLKPDASLDRANVELATIAKRLAASYPEADEGFTTSAQSFVDSYIGKQPRQLLYTMLGAVFFVLLIACANVANLLLDRAAHRTKEVGVRTALGASRGAVVRQFLAESLVLSLAATALGIVVAYFGVNLFNRAIAVTQVPFVHRHPAPSAGAALHDRGGGAHDARRRRDSGVSSRRAPTSTRSSRTTRAARRASASAASAKGARDVRDRALCGLLVAAGLMIKSVAAAPQSRPGVHDEGRVHRARRASRPRTPTRSRSGASSTTCCRRSRRCRASCRRR